MKKEKDHTRILEKKERAEQSQKDILDKLYTVLEERDAALVESFVTKGVLTGLNFKKGLKDMYRQYLINTNAKFIDPSKEQKKELDKAVNTWADMVENKTLFIDMPNGASLWDELHYVNRIEKNQDRKEGRAQRKTERNEAEVTFSETQLQSMLDTTAKEMGKDAFAKALYKKISFLRPTALNGVKWDNMA